MQYEAEGFIEKNKDTVPDEHLTLLQNAESEFLVEMLQTATAAAAAASAARPVSDRLEKWHFTIYEYLIRLAFGLLGGRS